MQLIQPSNVPDINETQHEKLSSHHCDFGQPLGIGGPSQFSEVPGHIPAGSEKVRNTDYQVSKGRGLSYQPTLDVWPELGKIHNLPVGLTGEGIKVALLDSGIFRGHTAFADKHVQLHYFNFIKDSSGQPLSFETAYTHPDNHGTAIAGLIFQVAPKVTMYIMRVATDENNFDANAVSDALDCILHMNAQDRPDIVSMSFSFPKEFGFKWNNKFNMLDSLGTLCVAAAGNQGLYQKDIPVPACHGQVISVGALNRGFGISQLTPVPKQVQVFAFGESLLAPCLPDSSNPTDYSCASLVNGTSMATALMAGLLALLLQFADRQVQGKCAKIRNNFFAHHVLTTEMQGTMESHVLRPYDFFTRVPGSIFQQTS